MSTLGRHEAVRRHGAVVIEAASRGVKAARCRHGPRGIRPPPAGSRLYGIPLHFLWRL